MHFQSLVVFLLLQSFIISCNSSVDTSNPCSSLESCSSCTQNPICSWCMQTPFQDIDKKPYPRCNTVEANERQGCAKQNNFYHVNRNSTIRDESLSHGKNGIKAVPIRPQQLSLKLRKNDPIMFDMEYQVVEEYPLDLYYLMDGTFTMRDDKEHLAALGDSIGERLRKLTSQFRLGFGTFVDKTTMPYVVTTPAMLNNPCMTIEGQHCVSPYGFQNHMKLSNRTDRFSEVVKGVALSGSSDLPEGGFDALMQVMVCEKQIGWSEQARRLIIFATDAAFHYAGDGKLGGIILPNDGKCHMDDTGEFYTHSLVTDYPSIAQINSKSKEHSMNIIFTVTSDQIPDYKSLTRIIEGSTSAVLARDSTNIVDLVEKQYKDITGKVEIKDSFPQEFFRLKYYSTCGSTVEEETNKCTELQAGTVVQFRVEIELIKCPPTRSEWTQQYKMYAIGVPDFIAIDVEALCDCPCENNKIPNSPWCGQKGSNVCGLCECIENYSGDNCECQWDAKRSKDAGSSCKPNNVTEACSGRGNCMCGQCTCSDPDRYSGRYCECDNKSCRIANGRLCGGNGKCICGTCECQKGWEGDDCNCPTDKNTCFEPDSEEECSGHGKCFCGKCRCDNRMYSGDYCEKCLHADCPNKCGELKHCVQCSVHGTGIYNPADCELYCHQQNITLVDIIPGTTGSTNEVVCKAVDPSDSCDFIFRYTETKDKTVAIDAQKEKECPPQAPIFWIITGLSGFVVLVGLILLCVYQGYRKIQVKREFAAYEKERNAVKWGQQTNPIYNNPVGRFQNPVYLGKE